MAPGIFLSLAPFVLSTTDRAYRTFGLELKHFLRPGIDAIVLIETGKFGREYWHCESVSRGPLIYESNQRP